MSGPLPASLAPLTIPASRLYRAIIAVRNAHFDRGPAGRVRAPVISLGNLTTGGTGKTPMVIWVAKKLTAAGRHPVIGLRGYGARGNEPSDETLEYAERLPAVPTVANPDRLTALAAYLAHHPSIDCVVLDDGFQHRRLARDLDVVLIDASRRTLDERLLPAGHLREPPDNLRRADAVVVTHAQSRDERLSDAIERHHGRPPVAWTRHRWSHLRLFEGDAAGQVVDVEWLRGKRVLTLLGVGHPHPILGRLEAAGARVAVNIPARDHERYDRPKMVVARGLCGGVDAMVTTGKDWAKARHLIDLATWPVPIVVPWLEIDVFDGAEALERMILGVMRAHPH